MIKYMLKNLMKAVLFCLLLFPVIAFSQQLSLQEAINITLKNNYDIQISKSYVDINSINNNIGIAGGLPTVSGTLSNQESVSNLNQKLNTGTEITKNGASTNTAAINVTGSMLLYNGYRVVATKKRLEANEQQSKQQLNATIQNTIAVVMLKYFDILRQQSYIKTLQQSIDLSRKQLEIITAKKEVGMANNADLFQSQIDLNTRLQDYAFQELIVKQAKTDLLTLMAVKADSAITINDSILVDSHLLLAPVLDSLQHNPDIAAIDKQIFINQQIEKETAAQRYPSLRANTGLNFGRTQSDAGQVLLNQTYGPFIGLSLSVPIYNAGITKRQEKMASINTGISKLQKESLVEKYKADIIKTYQSYSTNIQQATTQESNYKLSAQLVDLSMQRFKLSQATIIELREAQKSYESAGYRLVNLLYAAKIAEIELKRVSNGLGF
ncbi:MAG: TolC family protein [Bacteroidota bacterium]